MDLTQDYFSNFDLPANFQVDLSALASRHLQLQQIYHPDRFVAGTAAEQRVAVQTASYLNQAYAVLRSPLRRAIYLLQLQDMGPLAPTNTSMPIDFLMQQIELRERLDEISAASDVESALDQMADELQTFNKVLQTEFAAAYNASELSTAEDAVRKLQFIHKLQQQRDDLEGQLLD